MPEQPAPQPSTDNSVDAFIKEVAQPTAPAMEPGAQPFAPGAPGNAPENPYTPPQPDAPPVFNHEDGEGEEAEEQPAPKRSPDYQDKVLRGIIAGYDNMKATGFSLYSKSDTIEPFKMKEELKEDILICMEPFKEWIIDKCPAALPLILLVGQDLMANTFKAAKLRKTNVANAQGADDASIMQRVASTVSMVGQRTNYVLYDGLYRNDRKGKYIPKEEWHLREKPHIDDLEKILAIKANRHRDLLAKAFGWTNADFKKHNITE